MPLLLLQTLECDVEVQQSEVVKSEPEHTASPAQLVRLLQISPEPPTRIAVAVHPEPEPVPPLLPVQPAPEPESQPVLAQYPGNEGDENTARFRLHVSEAVSRPVVEREPAHEPKPEPELEPVVQRTAAINDGVHGPAKPQRSDAANMAAMAGDETVVRLLVSRGLLPMSALSVCWSPPLHCFSLYAYIG